MHDINFTHEHELKEHDFLGCCKDCQASLDIVKPHIMGFAKRIKKYTRNMLAALEPEDLYRLYQILDDLAHMETGAHLAGLILDEPDIRRELPEIRSYYSGFFSIHEKHLAEDLLKSKDPWETLKSFPFYPRYETLVRNQIEAVHPAPGSRLAFIGCGCAHDVNSHEPPVRHPLRGSGQLQRNRGFIKKNDPVPWTGKAN